jgi:hypothetical protein
VPFRFTIENRGDGDLEITDVKSGCSCSTPAVAERLIRPRQSTTLEGFVEAGLTAAPRIVHITVFTTDPERPQVQLEVALDVAPLPIRLSESKVVMSTRSRKEHVGATLAVDYTDPNIPSRVARVESSADWLTARLSADARQISVSADPLDSAGSRSGTLTLYTTDPEAVLRVPVEVHLIARLQCRPAQLYLDRKSEPGAVLKRTIELRPQADVALANVQATVRGVPGVVRSIRHVAEEGLWKVDVEFGPLSDQTAMTVGVVELTGDPGGDGPLVEIPVYVR